jgi:hypothetical protein
MGLFCARYRGILRDSEVHYGQSPMISPPLTCAAANPEHCLATFCELVEIPVAALSPHRIHPGAKSCAQPLPAA